MGTPIQKLFDLSGQTALVTWLPSCRLRPAQRPCPDQSVRRCRPSYRSSGGDPPPQYKTTAIAAPDQPCGIEAVWESQAVSKG